MSLNPFVEYSRTEGFVASDFVDLGHMMQLVYGQGRTKAEAVDEFRRTAARLVAGDQQPLRFLSDNSGDDGDDDECPF